MLDHPKEMYRISIKALILDEPKRFLLLLEENGLWELPGGGLNFGETPQECLKRELKEEAGLEVIAIKSQPSYFITGQDNKGQWRANVLYETTVKNLNFTKSAECIDLQFFTKQEALKEKLYTTVQEFIKAYDPDLHS